VDSDLLRQTYELRADAPPAMPVEAYIDRVMTEWTALLESDPPEPEVHAFLEAHPVAVPGAHLGIGRITPTGHAPFPQALITQPLLQGITRRTPDFLWLATDSLVFNPVFVEIEAPRKPWAISTGQQHNLLTQALEQITDWKEWLSNTANREIFFETYQIPRRVRQRAWSPVFVLIYGRKEESRDAVARIRRRHLGTDTFLVPYENLAPDPDSANYPCVRCSSGRYEAISVPPTLRLGPGSAEDWLLINGKEAATGSSPWMSPERQAFLIDRFSYWDDWARSGARGIRATADFE
jgi:hypothetical protein